MRVINVRLSDTYGCNVESTAVLQSIKNKFPKSKINVYTKYPELVIGLKEVNKVINLNKSSLDKYDVDFKDYLKIRKPQELKPFRHLIKHMTEIAESQLKVKLKREFNPKINLTKKELNKSKQIVNNLSGGKPIIWLQTKTRSSKKNMPFSFWKRLIDANKEWKFIDLSSEKYDLRTSIAITKFCDVGITLDTFLLHGSKAVGARNVIAIMVSSHKEVVTYPGNIVVQGSKINWEKSLSQVLRILEKVL